MKIGFLGPEGTFCEEASRMYCAKLIACGELKKRADAAKELIPYATIHDLLYAVDQRKINEAIVPIENSIEGTVGVVTDMLVKDVDLMIHCEIVIPIYHYLIAQKGFKLSDITDIISHPQALDQCRDFIQKKLPKVRLHFSYSTSEAVRQVGTSLGEKIIAHGKVKGNVFAAIGNSAAAKIYNLNILAKKINAKDNQTRFVVLAKKDHPPVKHNKTSIVFSIRKDRPGGLHDILEVFAKRNINLTKIESRPSKKALGDYYFFTDMEGHREDKIISKSLAEIKKKTSFYKFLGSYPKA